MLRLGVQLPPGRPSYDHHQEDHILAFRIEKPYSEQGLWYTTSGELRPLVHEMGLKCAALPMDPDPAVYQADGINWYSGCETLEGLYQWFSIDEMKLMRAAGFKLVIFNTELIRNHYGHILFSKQHLNGSQEIDLSLLT